MSNREERESELNTSFNHHIVGIGASAGGLEAILDLFDNIPKAVNCSYIIVQHLSPDYKSMMPELLAKHTKMQIFEASDGAVVKPGCIYVIPHKKNMTFKNGKLNLQIKAFPRHQIQPSTYFYLHLQRIKKRKR